MGLCIAFIALVRLPSLKVSTLLLVGLLIYDVFWVRPFYVLLAYFIFFPSCMVLLSKLFTGWHGGTVGWASDLRSSVHKFKFHLGTAA